MRKPEWQTCSLKKAIIRMWGAAEVEIRPLLWFSLSLLNIVNASPVHAVHIAEVLKKCLNCEWIISNLFLLWEGLDQPIPQSNTKGKQRKSRRQNASDGQKQLTGHVNVTVHDSDTKSEMRLNPVSLRSTPSAAKLEPHNWSTWCIFDGHLMCWGPKKLLSVKGRPHITSSNFRSLSKVNLIWKSSEIMQRCIEWLPGIVHWRASSAS